MVASDFSNASIIDVVDQTSERTDLAKRNEVKFAFSMADVRKLELHLRDNCQQQVHNRPVSAVRSIYFDDVFFSAGRDNIDGAGSRRKLRLRWYDSLRPQTEVFFEVKWREGRVTGKHRLQIRTSTPVHQLSYIELAALLEPNVPEHFRCAMLRYPEPAVIVQYDRQHFVSHNGDLRMTLDYNLRFYDQVGRQRVCTDFGLDLPELAVVEGKVPVGREAELRELLHPFAPRATRCSKYVNGLHLAGHVHFAE